MTHNSSIEDSQSSEDLEARSQELKGTIGIATGVLVLTVLNNGLSLVGAGTPATLLLNGAVLLAAVLIEGGAGAWLRERMATPTQASPST